MRRLVTPITITSENNTFRNVLNTFMDHRWDGFYTSMLRLSRWVSVIAGGSQIFYDINYKGTPPSNQRFALRTDAASVNLRIRYSKAAVYIVKDSKGVIIPSNDWDKSISQPALLRESRCGENRYIGVVNILEFHMKKGCEVYIEKIESIQTSIRLNWTFSEFYRDGGATQF